MRKRILAGFLALVMLVSLLPLSAVSAEVSDPALIRHTHTDAHACSDQCGGNVTWIPWDKADTLPAESGHYYLTKNVTMAQKVNVEAGKDITICLNGREISGLDQIFLVAGKLNITDCAGGGKVTGATSGAILTNASGKNMELNLYYIDLNLHILNYQHINMDYTPNYLCQLHQLVDNLS